jgi:transposase
LEQHRIVDLLPERSAESFQAWLTAHAGVEIISRDRGDFYIKGATAGAPNATQVADRWHLLSNLRKALVRIADHHPHQLLAAARSVQSVPQHAEAAPPALEAAPPSETPEITRNAENNHAPRSDRRRQRYAQVIELFRQGVSQREIARRVGIYRGTVGRYVHADAFPERAQRPYARRLDQFIGHLQRRWKEGCRNAVELTEELKQQGFKGSYYTVKRRVATWRQEDPAPSPTAAFGADKAVQRPSSRRIAWLTLKPGGELLDDERALLKAIGDYCPTLKAACSLAKRFWDLVRQRRADELNNWIDEASRTGVADELRRFAQGLKADLPAVEAAVTLPWSNGQTEGHVNRLKLIKRQMFGRAKFDLLRQRVIESAA